MSKLLQSNVAAWKMTMHYLDFMGEFTRYNKNIFILQVDNTKLYFYLMNE